MFAYEWIEFVCTCTDFISLLNKYEYTSKKKF